MLIVDEDSAYLRQRNALSLWRSFYDKFYRFEQQRFLKPTSQYRTPLSSLHAFEGRKSHPGNAITFGLQTKNKCCKAKNVFSTGANLFVGAWLEGPDPLLSLSRVLSVFCIRLFSFVS